MNSQIIDLAIGMVLVFAAVTGLASVLTELLARFWGLRAKYLLTGLRTLLDDGQGVDQGNNLAKLAELFKQPVLGVQGVAGRLDGVVSFPPQPPAGGAASGVEVGPPESGKSTPRPRTTTSNRPVWRSLPSYISPRTFATATLGLVIPNSAGSTTVEDLATAVKLWPDSVLKKALLTFIAGADGKVENVRSSLEQWYDDHMDRVSGWYKRYTAWITFVIGAVLIVLFNLNSVAIGAALYANADLRTAVAAVAAGTTPCKNGTDETAWNTCLENIGDTLSKVSSAGLPIGWTTVRACTTTQKAAQPSTSNSTQKTCNWGERRGILLPDATAGQQLWHLLLMVLGFLITVVALVPGARFWFDALSKLGSLRSTGPKPTTSAT